MKALYLLLILIGLFMSYRLIIALSAKRNPFKSVTDNPVFKDLKKINELMFIEETVNGEIQGGYGTFGFEPTNPIPVRGVFGETNYLARLRTKEGVKVEYIRLGHIRAENIDRPIDRYEIRVNGIVACTLYLYPYCKETSDITPQGYYLKR